MSHKIKNVMMDSAVMCALIVTPIAAQAQQQGMGGMSGMGGQQGMGGMSGMGGMGGMSGMSGNNSSWVCTQWT